MSDPSLYDAAPISAFLEKAIIPANDAECEESKHVIAAQNLSFTILLSSPHKYHCLLRPRLRELPRHPYYTAVIGMIVVEEGAAPREETFRMKTRDDLIEAAPIGVTPETLTERERASFPPLPPLLLPLFSLRVV